MTVICHGLGLLFAFLTLAPHAPATYDYASQHAAWSSR